MSEQPVIVLVHGAFAESASWNRVIQRLHSNRLTAVAVANPLRSVAGDAAYVRDVIAGIGRPVVLVGHSYGGMVISQAAAGNDGRPRPGLRRRLRPRTRRERAAAVRQVRGQHPRRRAGRLPGGLRRQRVPHPPRTSSTTSSAPTSTPTRPR